MIKVYEMLARMTKPANVDYYTLIDHGTPEIFTDQLSAMERFGNRGVKSWFQSGKKLFVELRGDNDD